MANRLNFFDSDRESEECWVGSISWGYEEIRKVWKFSEKKLFIQILSDLKLLVNLIDVESLRCFEESEEIEQFCKNWEFSI